MLIALFIVLGLVALLLILAALQPAEFRYERCTLIAAPPATIFPHVNELKNWMAWSPWEKMDPAMRRTFSGPASGVGATYAWEGNNKIGAGRMTITESQPDALIQLRLEFLKPFACTNRGEFTFTPGKGGTLVTWSMDGTNKFIGRLMGVFMNMDKLCGDSFAEGLATLKKLAESGGKS
jgi:hypothetical protein